MSKSQSIESKVSECVFAVVGDKQKLYSAARLCTNSAKAAILAMKEQPGLTDLLDWAAHVFEDSTVRFAILSKEDYEKRFKVDERVMAEVAEIDKLSAFVRIIQEKMNICEEKT